MADSILQRVVLPPRRRVRRLYYRCRNAAEFRQWGRYGLLLPRGVVFRTDTFFNAFFESFWRQYTTLHQLVLRLRLEGAGVVRIYRRRSGEQKAELLCEGFFCTGGQQAEIEWSVPSGAGLLYFEIVAHSRQVRLHRAEWMGREVAAQPVRLALGICTFNRPALLLRNLRRLFADRSAREVVERVLVVDQGREKVRRHPHFPALASRAGAQLRLLEQENRGGAGGFTRCLLEAQDDGTTTHVLLMDDDIVVEPECVARAAAFLSLARSTIGLAGSMLDRFRPCERVECGSRYLPERIRIDEPRRQRVERAAELTPLLDPQPRHYSGWWFFAFPLSVLPRTGLPLPLFLRGDDVEFGCRLSRHGIETVALPGLAVWHEPFEAKGRSWHPFYELRNLLIVGALHFKVSGRIAARQFFSRLLDELLTYDYYEAWLLCEAAAAYLRGPLAFREPDASVHQRLVAMQTKCAPQRWKQNDAFPPPSEDSPRSRLHATRRRRWLCIVRNFLRLSPSHKTEPQRILLGGGEQWYDLDEVDVAAIVESQCREGIVLRRSQGRFVFLFLRGLRLALRMVFCQRRMVRAWSHALPILTSPSFWKKYLNVSDSDPVCADASTKNQRLLEKNACRS